MAEDLDQVLTSIRPVIVRYCRARIGRRGRTFSAADAVAVQVLQAVLRALPVNRRPVPALVYSVASAMVDASLLDFPARSDVVVPWLLEELPRVQREILVLRVGVGLSAEETGEALGCGADAVRIAQHRALALIRSVTRSCQAV